MTFRLIKCPVCEEPLQGLQLTAEQRMWLDATKDAVIEHMQNIEANAEEEKYSVEDAGWLAISEPFLFLYGYMVSREDKKDS